MQRSNNRPTTTFINFSLYSRHTRAHAHAHTEKITFTEKDTVLTVKEGQTATILCELKGEPQPNVTWHFNGQPISVEGESPILMSFTQRCSLIFWIFSLYCWIFSLHPFIIMFLSFWQQTLRNFASWPMVCSSTR